MIRFKMPDAGASVEEKKAFLTHEFDEFLSSDALSELLRVLGTDVEGLARKYSRRRKGSGVIETQDLDPMPELEEHRRELYGLFQELGAFGINRPLKDDPTRILIYGGAIGTCFDRTEYSKVFVSEATLSVDALTCYRPINPVERKKCKIGSAADTELGALTEAFSGVYSLDNALWEDSFSGDRNLNSISCVRAYGSDAPGRAYRLFAAPSSEPEERRADTGDCLSFYLGKTSPEAGESLLAVTSNRYCNRQFIQTAYQLIKNGCDADFDIVGCHPDDEIETESEYDPLQYIQDLIGVIDWAGKFRELAGRKVKVSL